VNKVAAVAVLILAGLFLTFGPIGGGKAGW